jgi:hypothetical protein
MSKNTKTVVLENQSALKGENVQNSIQKEISAIDKYVPILEHGIIGMKLEQTEEETKTKPKSKNQNRLRFGRISVRTRPATCPLVIREMLFKQTEPLLYASLR